jgi:Flp pilus assembly pilin Flp
MESIRRFIRDETAVTAGEYGVILGAIAATLIVAMVFFYTEMGGLFSALGVWFGSPTKTGPAF